MRRTPAKRRPTVRRIKPAIVSGRRPVTARPATSGTTAPTAPGPSRTPATARYESVPASESAATRVSGAGVDLSVDLGRGLVLENPVLVASGTFGYGVEYGDVVDVQALGAICCKGTTLRPRIGNQPPRVTETPAGMLNSIGLQNPGVDGVIEKYAPLWATWRGPVIVNVAGESIEDYVGVVRKLEGVPGIAGIELNISCPNVGKGGLQFAVDAEAAQAVTAAVRAETELPLMVKLSPNVADVRAIARAIEEGGADSISAINTLSGIAVDLHARRPLLGNVYGGVSGPAIKPIALRVVYEVAQAVDIPVVGIGGIGSTEDALEFFFVGASAVQVGTAIFADPTVPARIVDGLARYCAEHGYGSVAELVGLALPKGPRARPVPPSVKGVEYRP